MRKNYFKIVAVVLTMSLFLTACGGEDSKSEKKAEVTKEAVAVTPEATEEAEPTPEPTEAPEERKPWITEINHYVMCPDVAAYFPTDEASMQAFKNAIDGIIAHESSIKLTDDWDTNLVIWGAMDESPYYFVVESADLSADHTTLEVTYKYDADEITEMVNYIDESYLEILNECITEDMSELEKVLSIYHYFANRISYDYEWYYDLLDTPADEKFAVPDIVVYDALKTNYGVCHSYTYLCQFAFQQIGIECLRVYAATTDETDSHMWPVVRIDGVYYNIDPTWDSNGDGTVGLKYFGMTDYEATTARNFVDYHASIDATYGEFACEDIRFEDWRDVVDFTMNYDGTITVTREDGTEEVIDL